MSKFKGQPPDISGPDLEHFEKTKHDKTSVRSMKIDEFLIFEKKFQKKISKKFSKIFFEPWEDDHVDKKLGYVQRRYMTHFEAIMQGYIFCIHFTFDISRHVTLISFFLNF